MTNQEAIRILNLERDEWDISHCTPLERRAAFNMAIEALKAQELKNVPDTNVGGMISRQAAIDTVKRYNFIYPEYMEWFVTKLREAIKTDLIEDLRKLPSVHPEPQWIPVTERLPECEQEVLICTMKKVYFGRKTGMEWYEEPIITPAIYEDGTMLEVNSKWIWEGIDYAGWDEEEDCGIIPEGWWENRHFNPDDVYNNVVDKKVIAWMPLPEPFREEGENE